MIMSYQLVKESGLPIRYEKKYSTEEYEKIIELVRLAVQELENE